MEPQLIAQEITYIRECYTGSDIPSDSKNLLENQGETLFDKICWLEYAIEIAWNDSDQPLQEKNLFPEIGPMIFPNSGDNPGNHLQLRRETVPRRILCIFPQPY